MTTTAETIETTPAPDPGDVLPASTPDTGVLVGGDLAQRMLASARWRQ
ncbi:MAG TPA: hypothetical protein VFZ70_10745 [Euzebyales bacterium]